MIINVLSCKMLEILVSIHFGIIFIIKQTLHEILGQIMTKQS